MDSLVGIGVTHEAADVESLEDGARLTAAGPREIKDPDEGTRCRVMAKTKLLQ
ncbi:GM24285 [Drosophila sechellia]|uniref:GM24285 n=1 Tax=Drosophila sechellia TaxID=7238 RepID=B4HLD7_DROSE|nr:GM24285 [Drosophila sechellia]